MKVSIKRFDVEMAIKNNLGHCKSATQRKPIVLARSSPGQLMRNFSARRMRPSATRL